MRIRTNLESIQNVYKLTGNCVIVSATESGVRLISYINDTTERVIANIDADVESIGNVVLDKEVITNLPKKGQLELSGDGGTGIARNERRLIKFNYKDLEFNDEVPAIVQATIGSKEFNKMIEVDFAVANNNVRPILTGVFIKDDNFVALDGFRLSMRSLDSDNISFSEMVVPTNLLKLYRKISKDANEVRILLDDCNEVAIEVGDITIVCNLLQGDYIKYKQLVNNQNYKAVSTVDAKELLDLLKSYKNAKTATFKVSEDNIEISAKSGDLEINDIINCETWGDDTEVSCNISYIVDCLKYYKGNITLKTAGATDPIYIEDNLGRLELILPTRMAK